MPPVSTVLILGGGVIGLSLARQLRHRSIAVTISDPAFALDPDPAGRPGRGASFAAAGMLAVEDPHNPPELLALSRLSRSLYNEFLADIEELSGRPVPFQTHRTWQTLPNDRILELAEQSLDPRQLAPALRAAVERLGATLTRDLHSLTNAPFDAVVYTVGAWTGIRTGMETEVKGECDARRNDVADLPVTPRKGQMLRVLIPPRLNLREVYRSEHVYVVPRQFGPQAGTALIGATVEEAGFDPTLSPQALQALRNRAAALVPALADEALTPTVEAWAGFRPSTPDALPILGELAPAAVAGSPAVNLPRRLVATGHYRNGILLAPGTAAVLADLLQGRTPAVSLDMYSPNRFPDKKFL